MQIGQLFRGRARVAVSLAVVGGVVAASLGGSAAAIIGQPNTSGFVSSPGELLGRLQASHLQIQQTSRANFFNAYAEAAGRTNLGQQCNLLIRELRLKRFLRNGSALPTGCDGLRNINHARDSFFEVLLGDGQQSTRLIAASLESDTHAKHGSRAYIDLWVDPQNPQASIAQVTLTNNWSDQPEILKSVTGKLSVNGENRFYVDVARAIPINVVGGNPTLKLFWYRYWWHDSHNHAWWWYGGYNWWYWQYAWYGVTWYWWWHIWWPWWHGYHWWYWSNWWGDLYLGRQP